MKAMLLAAGYGKRMLPLTANMPKPMLSVGGKPLLQYHVERLRDAGITDLIVNLAYLGEVIEAFFGDGRQFDVNITYVREPEPLETGGAIRNALPLLGEQPFVLVSGDVWTDYPFANLLGDELISDGCLGHLVLVNNPGHNTRGDFSLAGNLLRRQRDGQLGFTYSGIAVLSPLLVSGYSRCRPYFPLREALAEAIASDTLKGELYHGSWWDVGTPERLADLDRSLLEMKDR